MPNEKLDFKVSLARERARISELEDLLVMIRDHSDATPEIEALIETAFAPSTFKPSN